jgi:hypothetical protein
MDPVTVIVAALAAGAAAGVSEAASMTVRDCYAGLRKAVWQWIAARRGESDARTTLEALEADPRAARQYLTDVIITTGAGHSGDIVAAAQRLLGLLDPTTARSYLVDLREAKGVQIGDQNTQHNTFS